MSSLLLLEDDTGLKLQVDLIDEGNFPQNDGEAMVTKSVKDNMGLQVGDTVTVKRPDDTELHYKISGFCNNASKTMSEDSYGFLLTVPAFREIYSDGKDAAPADRGFVLYVQFSSPYHIHNTISSLKADCKLSDEQVMENTKLLGLLGQSSNSFMVQTYMAAVILFVLVLTAGIIMIAGGLSSNVAGRTEFFGLMRCIGATPGQVMKIVRKEALCWCRLAIPAGVIMGIAVIWVLCAILRVLSPKYFGAIPVLSLSAPSMIAGIVTGLLTVLLSSRAPAKRAAKVSPLAAVSGNAGDWQPVRSAAYTGLFKIETALGVHHAKAGRKKFILTLLSFAFSVILFLSFSVTIEFVEHSITPLYPWTADLSIISPDNSCSVKSALLNKIKENPAVRNAYGRMFSCNVPAAVKGVHKTADLISYEEKRFEWSENYLLSGSVQRAREEENTGLIVYKPDGRIDVGDTVTINTGEKTAEIKIAGILSTSPFHSDPDVETIICFENTFRRVTGESDYTIIDVQLGKNATDSDVNAIHQMVGNEFIFSDERMGNESARGIYYCMWLFVYGFLAVIALITVFHIINGIALSVAVRTRQYGAFQAIGMSTKQLAKMIIAEAVTCAVCGTAAGTVLGLFFHKILFGMMIGDRWGDSWAVPGTELAVIIFIMLLSVILAVYGPVKKIHHMSIVENINAL